jgi:hypothetical protein
LRLIVFVLGFTFRESFDSDLNISRTAIGKSTVMGSAKVV